MSEIACPQCGHQFSPKDESMTVCPMCRAIDAVHKQCWRCKREFVAVDNEGITCDSCKIFWANSFRDTQFWQPNRRMRS
jgi:uncharacterized Zn ribbon protein